MKSAAPITEAEIIAALRDCYDPALSLNIVDLGLVQSVSIATAVDAPGSGIPGVPARYRVQIAIILPDAAAAMESTLPALIQNRLAAFESIFRTEVEIASQPIWTPDCISPEGRQRIALHLTSKKPANALVTIQTEPPRS